jgi:hypothetical protein
VWKQTAGLVAFSFYLLNNNPQITQITQIEKTNSSKVTYRAEEVGR